ncbi:MAG TPA: iron donor protein CyaY [Polyangiales bacterium]|jgi:CyaY protein|nr:iron donor protein CyaY [Polyangiales bacterium]
MDEHEFERHAADTWKSVLDLFENVDPDDADVDAAGDVIRIDCKGGRRIVLNTQRPARQLWLAGGTAAFHFSYDLASKTWLDDKGRGELFATLRALLRDAAGISV